MRIGGHVEPDDPIGTATAENADCVQIFLGDPQGWKKPPPRDDAAELKKSPVPIYVHAPYIVNVASPNNRIRIPSRKILQQTCDAAAEIDAAAVIVHGGHVTKDDAEGEGFVRWRKAMEQLETDVPVYLENTAGGDHAMARHFDTIARLWDHIGDFGIGFCLDTCHAHAAGEDLRRRRRSHPRHHRSRSSWCTATTRRTGTVRAATVTSTWARARSIPRPWSTIVRAADAPVICETGEDGRKDDIAWLRDRLWELAGDVDVGEAVGANTDAVAVAQADRFGVEAQVVAQLRGATKCGPRATPVRRAGSRLCNRR